MRGEGEEMWAGGGGGRRTLGYDEVVQPVGDAAGVDGHRRKLSLCRAPPREEKGADPVADGEGPWSCRWVQVQIRRRRRPNPIPINVWVRG